MPDETPDDSIPDFPEITDEPIRPNPSASKDNGKASFFRRPPVGDQRNTKVRTTRVVVPKVKPGHFVEPLTQIYAAFGMAVMPFDPVCANAILVSASKCAESLDAWAQESDAVRRALFAVTQTTAVGMVLVAQNYLGAMGQQMAEDIAKQMEQHNNPPENPPE
jgi:hypothetical protein